MAKDDQDHQPRSSRGVRKAVDCRRVIPWQSAGRAAVIAAILAIAAVVGFRINPAEAQGLNCGSTTENCHVLQVGVNDDWAAHHNQTSEIDVAKQAGLDWLRFPWSWADTQPNGPNGWDWGYTDRIMQAAQASGEKVIFKPQGSPCWAHPSVPCTNSSTVPPDPEYMSQWQDYIRAVLRRYPDTIVAVEVWNEPNLRPFWDAPISPQRYAQILQAGYTAVKSVDPQMPVVSAGLAAVTSTDSTQMDYRSFLNATLNNGARGYFDATAIHLYPSYLNSAYLDVIRSIIGNVRGIVGPEMPIWVTEFGYPTSADNSDQQQSSQLTATLDLLAHTPNVPVAIVHRMFDKDGTGIWNYFGLVRADYSPKPSYCAVGTWTGSFSDSGACSISTQALSLSKAGDGAGTVTSSPSGVNCDTSCNAVEGRYPTGTLVTLTAAPAQGSTFAGWSGGCSGTSLTCTVTMDAAENVGARYNTPTTASYMVYVNKAGGGTGTVTSSPPGIDCGPDCASQTRTYPAGTEVTLTATAAPGSAFVGWSNACSGASTCTVTVNANKYVGAWFGPADSSDTVPPTTTIDSAPPALTNDATPTFGFSANETGSTFQCQLDGGAFADCSSPSTPGVALTDGPHTFAVRAVDPAGNVGVPVTRSLTVDTTAPQTTDSVDTAWHNAPLTVTLTATDAGAGVDRTYYTSGANPPDPTMASAVYDPAAKPVLGNGELIKYFSIDAAGNAEAIRTSVAARVDATAPDTMIVSGPSGPTNDATPTFTFGSSEAGSRFECKLDAGGWAACSSPTTAAALSSGGHTFSVRATDAAGNVDPTPAGRSFTVDTVAPNTTITSGPSSRTKDTTPTFAFRSSEAGSTFQCRVDASPWASCQSPHTTAPLANGSHVFYVRAVDPAGNADASPALAKLNVDTKAPNGTITAAPSAAITDPTPTFASRSSEAGSTFRCSLDGPVFKPCRSS